MVTFNSCKITLYVQGLECLGIFLKHSVMLGYGLLGLRVLKHWYSYEIIFYKEYKFISLFVTV